SFFFFPFRLPPRSTLFPYTTLFRSADDFDNSFLGHVQGNYQKGLGGRTGVNSPPTSSANVLQSLTTLRSGVLDATISMDFLVQRSEEHTSELQSRGHLVCRLLLEKK